ncbi:MAG: ADP-ribosylglycohydrolase family protein, partial [Bacteroidales bacterium]|nr:ADP-ribosylglycohydrolase family protein [Bacteroidales bacterium]
MLYATGSTFAQDPESKVPYRQISLEEYRDKVEGGWLGQAIAVLWGQWTEGIWQQEMIPFELNDWYKTKATPESSVEVINWAKSPPVAITYAPEPWNKLKDYIKDKNNWEIWTPDKMADQDDLYMEFMFLHSISNKGLDVTATEIAEDWLKYLDKKRTWGANNRAISNCQKGIWPPKSGHPHHSPYGNAIDFQIESDLFGLINPGMPRISNYWCDKVGHIMNYGDGWYSGVYVAAMYSLAFISDDIHFVVNEALKLIPEESKYYQAMSDVINWHQKYPDDWTKTWRKIEESEWSYDLHCTAGVYKPFNIDATVNMAYVLIGLLYGEGDIFKSMDISMRCGQDSDCN